MTDPDDAYAVINEANWLLAPATDAETLFQLLDYIAASYAPSARAPPEYGCSTAAVRTAIGALAASGGHVTLIECSAPLLGVGRVSSSEQSAVYGTEDESSMYLRSQDEAYYSELGVTCAMAGVCVDFVVASKEHVHLAEQQTLASQSGGSVYLVKDGAAGLAELHAYLQTLVIYSMQILTGVLSVAMCINFISMSKGSMERICEVLAEQPTITAPADPVTCVQDGSVDFCHVSFAYSARSSEPVLRDIDLHIDSGEMIGIIGATGSGKSSLVSLIPRLYDVSGGSVRVGGVNVQDYDLDVLRGSVAMVLQKNELFSGSIAENLRWGNENATMEQLRFAARQACAEEFIDGLPGGFDYDLGQGGVNVSGGQKQRLCIARALLRQPKVLIFDDSTSAVDTRTDAQIRQALRKYAPDTTKIIIAQRVASVQDADRIILLDKGRITDVGSHEELLRTSEIYRNLYESQMSGKEEG